MRLCVFVNWMLPLQGAVYVLSLAPLHTSLTVGMMVPFGGCCCLEREQVVWKETCACADTVSNICQCFHALRADSDAGLNVLRYQADVLGTAAF